MTAPFANKEWIETQIEMTNWIIINDFDHIIQKYDNKKTGWLWWKRPYSDYYKDENSSEYFKNIEESVATFDKLSKWKKPFVSFFSRINTKKKLLNYYYAKELLKKTKNYYSLKNTISDSSEINILINKIRTYPLLKSIGKALNKFASSVFSYINTNLNLLERENVSKNESIQSELIPNCNQHTMLLKHLFNKVGEILKQINPHLIQIWLSSDIYTQLLEVIIEHEKVWKLYPLLNSENNYIKQITSFYLLLHELKPVLLNHEEVLNGALNQASLINLALDWDVFKDRYTDSQKSLFEKLLTYYPVNTAAIILKVKCAEQNILISASPGGISTFKVYVISPKEFRSLEESCAYEFVLNSILKNLPACNHLDLSEASLAQIPNLRSILKNIPSKAQTVNICDTKLLKHSDEYLSNALNSLPEHLLSVKLIDKNTSIESIKRLDELSGNLKRRVTQNINLKNIAVNFITNYMKGSYDNKTNQLHFRKNNQDMTTTIPPDLGEIFISKQQKSNRM